MTESLGTISGQVRLDVKQALAAYAALRASNAATVFSLRGASKALLAVGTASLIAGVGLLTLFGKAISAAANFEKKIDFFGAITDATQADMDAVAKKAIEMGKTTIFSADQMAEAFVTFGKAGIPTRDILNGMADAVVNLATAADIDLNQATNILVSTMKTFRVSAENATSVVDLLAGAANASIIDVDDLGVSLKYVGGIAAATGVPLRSVVTAIALLGQSGIKGSTAGTSLRQILVSLNATSKKSQKELKTLGIITKNGTNLFIDQKGHLKPLADVFDILRTHTAKLTDAQRLSALKIIFNNRALAAANILLKDGKKGFEEMSKSISKVSAADVARKRLDNLAGDVLKLKNTFKTLFIQAGAPFQNFMRGIVQALTRAAKFFGSLSPTVQKNIFLFIAISGALLTMLGAFALFTALILKSIEGFILLRQALVLVGGGIRAVAVAFRVLTVALATNPFILIALAVVALVIGLILLYKHSARFRAIIQSVGKIAATVWSAMVSAFKTAVAFLISAGNVAIAFFRKWGLLILALVLPIIGIPLLIITHWSQIVDFFQALPGRMLGALKAIPGLMLALGIRILQGLLTGFTTFFPKIVVFLLLLPIRILALFIRSDLWLLTVGINIFFGLLKGFRIGVVDVIKFMVQLIPRLIRLWVNANQFLFHAGIEVLKGLWRGNIEGNKIVFNFLRTIPGKIKAIFANAVSFLFNAGKSILRGLYNGAVSGAVSILNFLKGLPAKFPGFFAGASTLLFDVGRQILQGLADGIASAVKGVVDAAIGVGKAVLNGIKGALGIGSPSKEAHILGVQTGEGYINGLKAMERDVHKAAVDMALQAVGGVKKTIPKLQQTLTDATKFTTSTQIPVNTSSGLGSAAGGTTIINNTTNTKSAVVNNPPPVPGEKQVLDAFKKMDALFGAGLANV